MLSITYDTNTEVGIKCAFIQNLKSTLTFVVDCQAQHYLHITDALLNIGGTCATRQHPQVPEGMQVLKELSILYHII